MEDLAVYPVFGVPQNPLYPTTMPAVCPLPGVVSHARSPRCWPSWPARRTNDFPVTESLPKYYGHPGVVFVPMTGWPQGDRTLWWRAQGNALIAAFIRFAAELVGLANPGYGAWLGPRTLGG